MQNKKGIQLSQSFGAVLAVVLVAVLVIIALFIFTSLNTSFAGTSAGANINESGGFINITGYTLTNATNCGYTGATILQIINATNGTTIIAAANYTLSDAGVLTNATVFNWPSVNINYTYTWGGEACNAGDDMITQFATYPALVGLVGTIIFLGLVIGVLVASFLFGGREEV